MFKKVILASASPRRIQLLSAAGLTVEQIKPTCEELIQAGESADQAAKRLSFEKASSIGIQQYPIIAADTIVYVDQQILGKPIDDSDAVRMLSLLAGKWHEVWTGFSVRMHDKIISESVCTRVLFRSLSLEEIHLYIKNEQPFDKAGSYAIQGGGCSIIDRIDGSISNVMGLPLAEVIVTLRELSFDQ